MSLHGSFIQTLEELNQLDEVRALAREVLYTYAQKVKLEKNKRYSKTIFICINFIYKHIYEDFTHNDVANHVELSPKYLSKLFKDEVGMSISDFIQEEKFKEAKRLLAYSEKPISEIALLLNFNDQSYFSRVFKKVAGITPKKYREKHLLLDKKE